MWGEMHVKEANIISLNRIEAIEGYGPQFAGPKKQSCTPLAVHVSALNLTPTWPYKKNFGTSRSNVKLVLRISVYSVGVWYVMLISGACTAASASLSLSHACAQ